MESSHYLYSLNYPEFEKELCTLEVKALFKDLEMDNVFFSNIKIDTSVSPYLKNRLEVLLSHSSFAELVELVEQEAIEATDFMVRYVKLYHDDPSFKERRNCCKQLGAKIHGEPLFDSPKELFGVTVYNGVWYFGILAETDITWKEHIDKPFSYSSAMGINMAKVLVNVAGNGDLSKRIVDPCCGVGTVLLEGVFAGYSMKGWDINRKVAKDARGNLKYFNYNAQVITGDIKNIDEFFDTAIIDLPYGNFSNTSLDELKSIIKNAKRISKKMIFVSAKDISEEIKNENLVILDRCEVGKNNNWNFMRYIWVCVESLKT